MNKPNLGLSEPLYRYLHDVSLRESPLLRRLREETAREPLAMMQIAPEQGQFLALLVKLMGARRAIEIGVFTGYSSLCIAGALTDDGRLVACDVNEYWTDIAQRYWREAGLAHKIALRLAPAKETLDDLLQAGEQESYDFIFVDADKVSYHDYYERGLALLRPGGLIAIDNVLWGGSVVDPAANDASTAAIRTFNAALHQDRRIDLSMVPIGDGVTLARKKAGR